MEAQQETKHTPCPAKTTLLNKLTELSSGSILVESSLWHPTATCSAVIQLDTPILPKSGQ